MLSILIFYKEGFIKSYFQQTRYAGEACRKRCTEMHGNDYAVMFYFSFLGLKYLVGDLSVRARFTCFELFLSQVYKLKILKACMRAAFFFHVFRVVLPR